MIIKVISGVYTMFRTKVRIHTCKVILLTSLVWFLVDVVVLTFYSDCVGGSGWGCNGNNAMAQVEHGGGGHGGGGSQEVVGTDHGVGGNSKGRGILYEQLHDRGKAEMTEKGKYSPKELRRWKPAPTVMPQHGLPGELGKAVRIPPEQEGLMKEKFKLNQFNLLASDMISFNRSLADVRLSG